MAGKLPLLLAIIVCQLDCCVRFSAVVLGGTYLLEPFADQQLIKYFHLPSQTAVYEVQQNARKQHNTLCVQCYSSSVYFSTPTCEYMLACQFAYLVYCNQLKLSKNCDISIIYLPLIKIILLCKNVMQLKSTLAAT